MVAKLDSHVALEENPDQQCVENQQHDEHDPYEAFETLSFCDLLTNGDSSSNWDADFFKEYHSSSFDRDEDNFFEFFNEELTASSYTSNPKHEDLIFCGKKLVPCIKEGPKNVAQEKKTTKKTLEKSDTSSTKKWGRIFRWRRFRRSKPKVVTKYSKTSVVKNGRSSNTISLPMSKGYKKCDPSVWKVSVINRSRSKWHLFMIGVTKFPTEMELRDMKIRQSRRNPTSTMFRAKCEDSNETMGKANKELRSNFINSNGNSNNSNTRAKGLWGLLRVLGCSSQHRNGLAF